MQVITNIERLINIKNLLLLTVAFFFLPYLSGQTAKELFDKRDYNELAKLEDRADKLTPEELYYVGFAFFQLENDEKAIAFYDKAIAKGLQGGSVHFYKGLSLRYMKKFEEALKEIDISLELDPANQEFMNEKGLVYYYQDQYDKALQIFEVAKKLSGTYPEPYYWIARIYHKKEDFAKALAGYYEAIKYLPKENSFYLDALVSIGQLEYTYTMDYNKSARAYAEAIQMDNETYELYYKLIKSYNAAKAYSRADSIFDRVKTAFKNGKLPKDDMEIKSIAVAQFEWNGQVAVIRKSLVDPKEMLDISYKVFLLNKAGDKVERRFVVEKTIQISKDDTKHLLCEEDKKTGTHYTYPYGWSMDNIPVDDLQKAVIMVLEGKMKASASSSFGK